jgi:hypothetical protein
MLTFRWGNELLQYRYVLLMGIVVCYQNLDLLLELPLRSLEQIHKSFRHFDLKDHDPEYPRYHIHSL